MLSVALPIWLIIAAAGLPAVCFLFIGLMLVRLKRRGKKNYTSYSPHIINTPVQFNNQVYKQLVEQQIDAVFNTLITVIESERMKLKALVGNPAQPTGFTTASVPMEKTQRFDEETHNPTAEAESNALSDQPLGQSIAALSKKGMTAEQIARQLGLSQSEMALAVKMNNSRKLGLGNKVRTAV